MSDMLSIGASGVRAYQTALTTVSENIANASTPGYSKRVANVREVAAAGAVTTATINGLGSAVSSVTRAGDMFRAAEVRNTGADLARTETSVTWLDRIDGALSDNKLSARLTDFFNSANAVAADPASIAPRATMLENAASVASAFSATGDGLAAAAADLDASADAATGQLNNLAASLAKVNAGIGRTPQGTSGAAALLDQRDQLLEQMSAITNVSTSFDPAGRVTVRAGDNGPLLVEGEAAGTVTYVRNDAGATSFAVHMNGSVNTMSPAGGALAGMAEGAQRIADARTALDTLAQAFVTGVNNIQAHGRDLSGNPGAGMFTTGETPSKVELVLSDPRGIAAAGSGGGVRDNSNLLQLQNLRSSGGFETKVTDMVATNGAALSGRQSVADAQSAIRDSAVAARDSASGVNLDEEAVDLLRFQQAYQASSRVIQVSRETLQTILDMR